MTFTSYMELAEAARAQIDAGDREAALAVLAGAENSLPLHAGHVYSWRAALLAEIGHTDAALDALDAALAAGCRFKAEWLRDNPRLAPLQGMPRFDEVVDRAAARYTRMQAETRPALEAFIPTTPRPAPPGYPTLIALHGNNSNVGQTQPYWETATALGWLVALPQSGEIGTSPNSFTWNDRDRTLAEVEQHLLDLRAQSLVDDRAACCRSARTCRTSANSAGSSSQEMRLGCASTSQWEPKTRAVTTARSS